MGLRFRHQLPGFGSRLIQRAIAAEFGSEVELEFKPDGLACTIRAPVEALSGSLAG
jgi:two-component sensor histidine kinase